MCGFVGRCWALSVTERYTFREDLLTLKELPSKYHHPQHCLGNLVEGARRNRSTSTTDQRDPSPSQRSICARRSPRSRAWSRRIRSRCPSGPQSCSRCRRSMTPTGNCSATFRTTNRRSRPWSPQPSRTGTEVSKHIPLWMKVKNGDLREIEFRQENISARSVVMRALGAAGGDLMKELPDNWQERDPALESVDWEQEK
jgi:hypothetical protein